MEGNRKPGATAGGAARLPRLAPFRVLAVALVVVLAVAVIPTPAQEGEPFRSPGGVRTGIFGLETRGNRFVYVFDRSASMADPDGRPLAAAKRELLRSLDDLGDVQQFHVIFYNDRHQVFTPEGSRGRAVFATEANRRAARRFVESVRPAGGTRHAEPLAAAFQLAPDAVFLLTDADAGDDLGPDDIERLVRLAAGARCMVIQFGDGDRRSPGLAEVAARCGGEYRVVSLEDAEAAARGAP